MKRTEDSLRDLWAVLNAATFELQGSQKKKRKGKGMRKIEQIIVENFSNMGKEIVNQAQEAQRVPFWINPMRNMPRHTVIKLTKTKHKEEY